MALCEEGLLLARVCTRVDGARGTCGYRDEARGTSPNTNSTTATFTASTTVATSDTPVDLASIKKTVVMKVTGMSCQGCANALKNKVDGVDGVVTCDVSFEKGQASVALSNPDAEGNVEAAIKKLGYTVSLVPEDAATNPAS